MPFDRIRFTEAAVADLQRLADDDPGLVVAALKVLARVNRGEIQPKPLAHMAKTGDLIDCSRVYFGLGDTDIHRVVLHHDDDGLTIEAIAADTRAHDRATRRPGQATEARRPGGVALRYRVMVQTVPLLLVSTPPELWRVGSPTTAP